MGNTVGTMHSGQLWLRCPHCGDSERHPDKGHLAVNLERGLYYCVRCGEAGSLSVSQVLDLCQMSGSGLVSQMIVGPQVEWEAPPILPLAGSRRASLLNRYHATPGWDVFRLRDPRHNEVIGQYFRREGKLSITSGESGLDWVGDGPVVSSPDDPIRLVEGPYDVISDRDVAVFGFLSRRDLEMLQGHCVILCPDGDVWQDQALATKISRLLEWAFNSPKAPHVVGLEYLKEGKDPDEVPIADRAFITRAKLIRGLYASQSRQAHRGSRGASRVRQELSSLEVAP